MVRVTNALATHRRRKRMHKLAKGFWGDRKNHLRVTSDAVNQAMAFAYKHRRQRKRDFRSLWIVRLGVATRMNGISYSKFIGGLRKSGCLLDRKVLADMALRDPVGFTSVVDTVKLALAS